VLLENGIVFFAVCAMISIYSVVILLNRIRSQKLLKSSQGLKMRRIGVGLVSFIIASSIMFATVSPVDYIPVYYWMLIGLTVAYLNVVENMQPEESLGENLHE